MNGSRPACSRRARPQGLLEYHAVVVIDWSFLSADGAMTEVRLGGAKTSPNPPDRTKRGDETISP